MPRKRKLTPAAAPQPPRPTAPAQSSAASSDDAASTLFADAAAWLERRKLAVPATLRAGGGSLAALQLVVDEIMPSLRERDKRALSRFVEKCRTGGSSAGGPSGAASKSQVSMPPGADDSSEGEAELNALPRVRGGSWPEGVTFSSEYRWGSEVPEEVLRKYGVVRVSGAGPTAPRRRRPCRRAFVSVIDDAEHPAHGQCGLFATEYLPYGTLRGASGIVRRDSIQPPHCISTKRSYERGMSVSAART